MRENVDVVARRARRHGEPRDFARIRADFLENPNSLCEYACQSTPMHARLSPTLISKFLLRIFPKFLKFLLGSSRQFEMFDTSGISKRDVGSSPNRAGSRRSADSPDAAVRAGRPRARLSTETIPAVSRVAMFWFWIKTYGPKKTKRLE